MSTASYAQVSRFVATAVGARPGRRRVRDVRAVFAPSTPTPTPTPKPKKE